MDKIYIREIERLKRSEDRTSFVAQKLLKPAARKRFFKRFYRKEAYPVPEEFYGFGFLDEFKSICANTEYVHRGALNTEAFFLYSLVRH